VGDFVADEIPELTTKAVHRDFERTFRHAERCCGVGAARARFISNEVRLEMLEVLRFAAPNRLRLEARQRAVKDGNRPAAVEDRFRCLVARWFALESSLGTLEFERQNLDAAAALRGHVPVAFVGGKILERRQQKGAKAATTRIGMAEGLLLENLREERLRQVLRFISAAAAASKIRVERIPIRLTQARERFVGPTLGNAGAGSEHQAPTRRCELSPASILEHLHAVGAASIPWRPTRSTGARLISTMPTVVILVLAAVTLPGIATGQPLSASSANRQQQTQESTPPGTDVVVVTASRREEELLNAPATMTVITDTAIQNASSQEMADLLRGVAGMNTVQTSARDLNVTSRAATGTLSDSMLVLLDGRSIYQDFFGFVMWDFVPVATSEMKQIEVIHGPASAVWGANAMTGVINIITKSPREMLGTTFDLRFGQFDRSVKGQRFDGGGLFAVHATHAEAPNPQFAYKISASFLVQEPFSRPSGTIPGTDAPFPAFENQGTTQPKIDARADYDLPDGRRKLTLSGGIAGTEGIMHTGLGPLAVHRGSTLKYGKLGYRRNMLQLQAFVNALDGEASGLLLLGIDARPLTFGFENQAYDVEFSNLHLRGERHLVSYGGNYRHNNFNLQIAPRSGNRDEGGGYVQDQIFLSRRFRWVVGGRVDRFDVLHKAVFSPRTTFIIKPREKQSIRLSYNRAFRAPSFVNSFLDTALLTDVDLGARRFRFPVSAAGNANLKEEALTAYEAGYIAELGRATISAAAYLNRTRNMIQFTEDETYTSSRPPPGWPLEPGVLDALAATGRGLPSRFTYRNFAYVGDRGAELSLDGRVTTTTDAFANYSWQAQPRPKGFDLSELNLQPTHRFNAGANVGRDRYFGSLSGSYVGAAFWQDVFDARLHDRTRAYTLVNGAFGVHSADRMMTIVIRATNMLNRRVQQHIFGDFINRTVTGEVHFTF
jgi:outer membrane receptor protein involved in Fe transport